jgi:hypothetical protein
LQTSRAPPVLATALDLQIDAEHVHSLVPTPKEHHLSFLGMKMHDLDDNEQEASIRIEHMSPMHNIFSIKFGSHKTNLYHFLSFFKDNKVRQSNLFSHGSEVTHLHQTTKQGCDNKMMISLFKQASKVSF